MNDEKTELCRNRPRSITVSADGSEVAEAPRRVPVAMQTDVLVVGGGPAGVGAAMAAAREGADTLLIERDSMLGGMWTMGLVNPFFEFKRKGWLVAELIDRLVSRSAWLADPRVPTFDTEIMKCLLEQMMQEAGAEFRFRTLAVDAIVEGNRMRGVVTESKAGREAILARVVIDCTGDGDVAAGAGVPYEMGRPADGFVQPMTLMCGLDGLGREMPPGGAEMYDLMSDAIKRHGLEVELPFEKSNYVPWILLSPRSGNGVMQATHVYRLNPLDPRELTRGIVEARRQAAELVEVLRHLPGLEGVRLTHTAPAMGVRESRRIKGHYRLDREDLAAGRRFEDAVTACSFGVDIHEPAPGSGIPSGHESPLKPYEIPYRCLLPSEVEGMLVAGRCISGSHEAHASYRVTGTCMATGQAAGLAAASAVKSGASPASVDGTALRRELEDRGAGFIEQ